MTQASLHKITPWLLAVLATLLMLGLLISPALAAANVQVLWSNEPALSGLRFGDFNGDGRTDIFRISGTTQWQYSPSGSGDWLNLFSDPSMITIDNLRFGDFNGDGRTDVFSVAGTQWRYSSAGASNWIPLASDATPLSSLRFGDFNGDGRTDVFSVSGTQWRYSSAGESNWIALATDSASIDLLRFGDFDGDGRTDVFTSQGGQWQYSSAGASNWIPLAFDPSFLSSLRFGDFDADGRTDVFSISGTQWRYSSGGVSSWIPLASDSTLLQDLRFGDFNGDMRTDVFSISGSQWRYSAGGASNWIILNPGMSTPLPPYPPTAPPPPPSGPIAELRFGDFNSDGRTDVFRSMGGQWQYSSAGVGPWINLAYDPMPPQELRFGAGDWVYRIDFDGDRRTDVFSVSNNQWRYSSGGASNWIPLAIDPTPLDELRFGDFDGNGRTDVFSTQGGQWRYSADGMSSWIPLAFDNRPIYDLRFGDFNGDGITDVFSIQGNQWQYSPGGSLSWIPLAVDSTPLQDLRFGDFNGDRRTDVFSIQGDQWRYSSGGASNWIALATDSTPLNQLRFGDFNGDGRTDVFSIGPNGRWRYSSAGTSNWMPLGPPEYINITPTPTWIPRPTITSTPVPPLPNGCVNIAVNSDMERAGGWLFGESPVPATYSGAQSHSGLRSIQMGNPPNSGQRPQVSYSSVRQPVTIPNDATTAQLRWWHMYYTQEAPDPNPGNQSDRQEVILLTPHGKTLRILNRVRSNDGVWQEEAVDLTQFIGQTFYIYFNVYNDNNPALTWMFLDDVTVDVCYPPPTPTPPPTFTPPPTYTPTITPTGTPTGTPTNTATATATSATETPTSTPTPTEVTGSSTNGTGAAAAAPDSLSVTPLPAIPTDTVEAVVTGVIDGETIEVVIESSASANSSSTIYFPVNYSPDSAQGTYTRVQTSQQQQPAETTLIIRYADIIAPPTDTPEGEVAAAANRALVEGQTVFLEIVDSEPDEQGAVSAYVFLENGELANAAMVRSGHAVVAPSAAGSKYEARLLDAQAEAQESARGMWRLTPVAPETAIAALEAPPSATPPPSTQMEPTKAATDKPTAIPAAPLDTAATAVATAGNTPDECTELITNGSFEDGDMGWTLITSERPAEITDENTFGDSDLALRLGIVDDENTASISAVDQIVHLPEDASSIILSLRYYPLTDGEPGPGDLQYIDIYNAMTGQFAGRVVGAQMDDRTWLAATHDLTPLAGQPVRIVFAVNNDGVAGSTAVYLDDVSILACNFESTSTPEPASSVELTPTAAGDAGTSDESDEDAGGVEQSATPANEQSDAGATPTLQTSLASRDDSSTLSSAKIWLARMFTGAVMFSILGIIAVAAIIIINTDRSSDVE